jgi:hypothetical protein
MRIPPGVEFYATEAEAPPGIAQGDIFLCPVGALLAAEGREVPPGTPPTPGVDDIGVPFVVRAWEPPAEDGRLWAPAAVHEGRWGPVMVITHECDLQKDFNALGRICAREEGLTVEEVEQRLARRLDLDRYAVVAPVLSYDELRQQWPPELRTDQREGDVRRGTRMDFFPLPAHPAGLLSDSVVSFVRMGTIERGLLECAQRIASLSEPARAVLRYKLGSQLSIRDASVLSEIEAAVGQRIVRTAVTPIPPSKGRKKQVSVVLHLENGDVLHLQGEPIREATPEGPERSISGHE